ncbi:MAG: TPM domain-containing protein [Saprospiraceae bacterium]|nr:TPM domain-containing protein [Saprospiraceae bacterium]
MSCRTKFHIQKTFNKLRFSRYILAGMLLLLTLPIAAKEIPPKPNPPRLVNDFARMLSASEVDALERKLVAYNDSTSTQIAIVTERTLEGDDDFDYALRIYNTWNIGQQDKNNGVLIYIALEDRKIRFITGYGAEGFLPDAIAKRIIENIIKPAFREEQYYAGFDRATNAIISYASGEYSAEDEEGGSTADLVIGLLILAVIVGFFLFILIAAIRSNKNDDDDDDGGYWHGGRYDEPRHRNRGGGWIFIPPIGGGGSGGGGWSGGGGGGFGGFGGGFSGGGGAGGDW